MCGEQSDPRFPWLDFTHTLEHPELKKPLGWLGKVANVRWETGVSKSKISWLQLNQPTLCWLLR